MSQTDWPFIIIRNFGTGMKNKHFIRCTFDAQQRHHGLIGEIWFGGNALDTCEANAALAEENIVYRDECKKLGILFSYQQGITLNHEPDGDKREHLFSKDAWAVSENGQRCYGLFCANSEEAQNFTRIKAENLLKILQPDSYWPDDDLRMFSKLKGNVCFCDRCLALFNQKYGHDFNREQLTALLFGDTPSGAIRKEWTLFNGESLGNFAASFRIAVDNVQPSCRLGIQTVYSHWQYDGPDYKPIIMALAGPDRKPVGVRPGAGYYSEYVPRDMMAKALTVGEEAARCKHYDCVGQLCYEAENWPHVSSQKTPEAQMIECSLALASGMDSLALYWGADINGENDENYAFYYDTLAEYKPYFMAIREAFKDSRLAGGALYHGSNTMNEPEWCSKEDQDEMFLMSNALPIVRESSEREFHILNHRAVRELAENDLSAVFSGAVLMDSAAFTLLAKRFPQLSFTGKVKLTDVKSRITSTGGKKIYECFETDRFAGDCNTAIKAVSPDVKYFSSITLYPDEAGICTIPTEYGGNVVLIQQFRHRMWSGYRRKAILDALDSVIAGKMSARLLTNGFAVNILARKDDRTNRTIGAFLLNLSIGNTPTLELAIRNPAFKEYQLILPKQAPIKLTPIAETADEKRFSIAGLNGWQSALITGTDN